MAYYPYMASTEFAFRRPVAPIRPTSPGRSPNTGRRTPSPAPNSAPLDDFAADIGTTGSIVPGGVISGVINTSADSDWFAINLQAGRTYTVTLTGKSLPDPILTARDSRGLFLAENDDINSETNLNSRLQFSPVVSGTYFLEARGFLDATGSYELKVDELTQSAPLPQGGFQIDIDYTGDPQYLPIFEAAAARWERVITGDLPDVNGIDDLLITVNVEEIDGLGGTLGFAGPDSFRSNALGGLPLTGSTTLDRSDLSNLDANGILDDTVLHEFGHILGIGTIWDRKGLRSGSNFIGENAIREYQALVGQNSPVPLETNGGPGTALGHWSEDVFDNELMTGFIDRQSNPLSRLTIASLQDKGYTVNYSTADSYSLPSGLRSVAPQASINAADDMLVNSLQGCYCATCAAFSMPGAELAQFSKQVERAALGNPAKSSAKNPVAKSLQLPVPVSEDVRLTLPLYLTTTEVFKSASFGQLSELAMPFPGSPL